MNGKKISSESDWNVCVSPGVGCAEVPEFPEFLPDQKVGSLRLRLLTRLRAASALPVTALTGGLGPTMCKAPSIRLVGVDNLLITYQNRLINLLITC